MVGQFFDVSEGKAKRKIIASDPKRVISLLLLLAFTASFNQPIILAGLGLLVLVLCIWAGISWRYACLRLLLLIPFGLGAIVLLPFAIEGHVILTILGFTISLEGVLLASRLIAKLVLCHFILCILLSTTSFSALLRALIRIGIPTVIVEIMLFTLRYLAVLFEEIERMILAQQSRGLTIASFASWSSYKRCGELLGVLLIRSYERSGRIYQAMLARGYGSIPMQEGEAAHERHSNQKSFLPVSGQNQSD
ncbi:cobalt ECF transporter T component CbiQ [Ammoniphilus sp. YIM 78166]|uniref:cobalt ECF transporter T component CbiQ n=1 Tax=Ammoniphilus sp. YIM 78166 TaxID=1644106 RepID=UPI0010703885|nr:cobalt ECF transporter T component CbiQ [Ammoniphilus sp. YIM 78166]